MSVLSIAKTLFKSLFHGPYTVEYPLKEKELYERTRGKIDIDIASCIFCSICEKRCPTSAIKVDKGAKAWSIERLQCIQCNYCVDVCPKKCLTMDGHYTSPAFHPVRDQHIKEGSPEDAAPKAVAPKAGAVKSEAGTNGAVKSGEPHA